MQHLKVYILFYFYLVPPKFPAHLSKECKSFLMCCLQRNSEKRLSAKKLLDHPFFTIGVKTQKENNKLSSSIKKRVSFNVPDEDTKTDLRDSKSLKGLKKKLSRSFDRSLNEKNNSQTLTKKILAQKNSLMSNNLIKNKNFHIVNKNEDINHENILDKERDKNIVNILSDNSNGGAFFSVSMTVYSQQSLVPQGYDVYSSKENKILPDDIVEVEEPDNSPFKVMSAERRKNNFFNFNMVNFKLNNHEGNDKNASKDSHNIKRNLEKIYEKEYSEVKSITKNKDEESNTSINNLLNNYESIEDKKKDKMIFTKSHFHKLKSSGTLEFKEEDMQKLEEFFVENVLTIENNDNIEEILKNFIKQ